MADGQKISLKAGKRDVFGKKLRKLRNGGDVPANIFGTDYKSQAITISAKDFYRAFKVAGETGIVYLQLDKDEIPTLVSNVQDHPVNSLILHVDFRKVDLKKAIEAKVPVKVVGESVAVEQKGGVLLTQVHELTVEALPQDIPHDIEIDISKIQEVGEEIKVADLAKSDKYKIMEEADKVIVSVIEHKEESLEPETTAEAPEILEGAPAEGEEGVVEGEPAAEAAPADEGAPKEKDEKQAAAEKPAPEKKEEKKGE